jgi:hypothetical protein
MRKFIIYVPGKDIYTVVEGSKLRPAKPPYQQTIILNENDQIVAVAPIDAVIVVEK